MPWDVLARWLTTLVTACALTLNGTTQMQDDCPANTSRCFTAASCNKWRQPCNAQTGKRATARTDRRLRSRTALQDQMQSRLHTCCTDHLGNMPKWKQRKQDKRHDRPPWSSCEEPKRNNTIQQDHLGRSRSGNLTKGLRRERPPWPVGQGMKRLRTDKRMNHMKQMGDCPTQVAAFTNRATALQPCLGQTALAL